MSQKTSTSTDSEALTIVSNSEQKDYQFLLEENLALLRQLNDLNQKLEASLKKELASVSKIEELKRESSGFYNELRARPWVSYKLLRKLFLCLQVLLAIFLSVSGTLLWYFHKSPADACLTAVPGILWLGILTIIFNESTD